MAFRFGHTTTPVHTAGARDVESLAYTLLETARIRCESLAAAPSDEGHDALRGVHRDLGLAGYYISADFAPGQRLDCLALAHQACSSNLLSVPRVAVETIFDDAVAAADALSDLLTTLLARGGDLERGEAARHVAHVHAAQLHVTSASESLEALLMDFDA